MERNIWLFVLVGLSKIALGALNVYTTQNFRKGGQLDCVASCKLADNFKRDSKATVGMLVA